MFPYLVLASISIQTIYSPFILVPCSFKIIDIYLSSFVCSLHTTLSENLLPIFSLLGKIGSLLEFE